MSEIELQDAILRHAIELQRLSANDEAQAVAILQQLEDELKRLVASNTLSEAGKRQIDALIKQADNAIAGAYDGIGGVVDTHQLILTVSENTQEALGNIFRSTIPLTVERITSLADEVLIQGSPTADWWARQAEDTAFKFAAQVRQGVVNGETNEQIVSRVFGKQGEPGIMDVAKRNVRSLVHSSIMSAANSARLATFKKNSKHLDGVRWLATLDGHTCNRCAALDGQAWDFDGQPIKGSTMQFQAPPIHMNDRCVLTGVPKRKSLEDAFPGISAQIDGIRERASSQGPISGDTSFDAFFARQTPAQQDEQFGKTRAEMFRQGKITVKDLVSGTSRPLTLKQLRKKAA